MKKKLTGAQEEQRQERKAKFALLVKRVGAMTEAEKEELAKKMAVVVNCDGHALSFRNTFLIALQLGFYHATIVGGFRNNSGRADAKPQSSTCGNVCRTRWPLRSS